ncbi:hypothetical protein F7734_07460 [Scytonema sp. UIC 10036]|uniref:hypothetical protein n=1 Tax=Scytonema sp. UIC 10036 TaxID=2304196 RepID=UPI0012DA6E59|nr:hypothetical protein [Scytonema sp. UIC 10036]MUG92301.1 hypothetical protein [Scytonema sp. UIC 10036]
MFAKKIATIGLLSVSATAILFANAANAQVVNQQIKGVANGPETFVDAANYTENPTGILNQAIDCEARNDVPQIDPRCDARNTAIYDSHRTSSPTDEPEPKRETDSSTTNIPSISQQVENGGTNTTVITPTTANSDSNSSSESNSSSDAKATIRDSGNSHNTNENNAQGGSATVGHVNNSSSSSVGDQKNQQSVTTGATTVAPNVSPSTRVKVEGARHNHIQFGSQAPGTGGEAFSFQYSSACGASVNYRQGFALKPKRIGGGGLGFALDVSSTGMDTIESRDAVQNKMESAFLVAMSVVNNQQTFEQRLNSGAVSRQEAYTRAIANCASFVPNSDPPTVYEQPTTPTTDVDKPRTCTAVGCN